MPPVKTNLNRNVFVWIARATKFDVNRRIEKTIFVEQGYKQEPIILTYFSSIVRWNLFH